MEFVNQEQLVAQKEALKQQWNDPKKPFRYLIYDNIFLPEKAEEVLQQYPDMQTAEWDYRTYINQNNKYTLTKFGEKMPVLQRVFDELNGREFLSHMEEITGIDQLMGDDELFGGGLHMSVNGAFLDVHVDFNLHEKTKYHRRMNAIIFMNKDWKQEYNGYLELWDMKKKKQLENVAPLFNRCVVFETNEVSFHGHPKKLNTPEGVARKSLAVYYYTKDRPAEEVAEEHNTIYVNTEGTGGKLKNFTSGVKAFIERIKK